MADDNAQARNLADDLFGDLGLQLPEQSHIRQHIQPQSQVQAERPQLGGESDRRKSKYAEEDDDALWNIELAPVSSIHGSQNIAREEQPPVAKQSQNQLQPPKKTANTLAPISRITRKGKSTVQKTPKKPVQAEQRPQIDIDAEIGEVAQWAERGVRDNQDEEDFNEGPKATETQEQAQIRKRLADKLREGGANGQRSGGLGGLGGGLKAKAEQLKKQNSGKDSTLQQTRKISQSHQLPSVEQKIPQSNRFDDTAEESQGTRKEGNPTSQSAIVEDSSLNLMEKQASVKPTNSHMVPPKKGIMKAAAQEDEDDPWDKVNQHTIQQFQQNADKRRSMTLESALGYFQEFAFDPQEIDDSEVGGKGAEQDEEPEEQSFFASLCACLKPSTTKRKPKFNLEVAKRLVAISKKQLTSVEEEFFLLKTIWFKLTDQEFSRYGGHWNLIGFQGRDPATDLRSTGVLSLVQWAAFIQRHIKLSDKYSKWSMKEEFPLALSHIKLTGAFLDLLSRGIIRFESWDDFQKAYNCLVIGFFDKMMKQFSGADMGSSVEDQVRQIKKSYRRLLVVYEAQYEANRK